MANNQNKAKNQNKPKSTGYISPLKDELKLNLQSVGEGVQLYYDTENGRLLLDIDVSTRRGISSSGKTVKIATATHMIKGKKKLSLNIFDKDMNDSELDQLEEFLERETRKKNLASKVKALSS